jgi:hypothetical protein
MGFNFVINHCARISRHGFHLGTFDLQQHPLQCVNQRCCSQVRSVGKPVDLFLVDIPDHRDLIAWHPGSKGDFLDARVSRCGCVEAIP